MNISDPEKTAIIRLKAYIKLCREAKISKSKAKELLEEHWPKKAGLWPEKNKWWSDGPNWLHKLLRQYKFLQPILTELRHGRHIGHIKGMHIVDDGISIGKKKYLYAIIKLDEETKARIIRRVGCSPHTLKRYMATLVKCGVLKEFNRGRLGRFYSISYWAKYRNPETGNWDLKRNPLLTKSNLINLKKFKINW